jgi:hypothetical protein
MAGLGLGGVLVIIGIVLLVLGYTWIGIIVGLIGLLAFGGFAKGKWYLVGFLGPDGLAGPDEPLRAS